MNPTSTWTHNVSNPTSVTKIFRFIQCNCEVISNLHNKTLSQKLSVKGRTLEMETPLVPEKFSAEADYLAVKGLKDVKFVFWTETVKIWRIAFPMALSAIFQFLTVLSNSVYAGHLGDLQLSSLSVYHGVLGSIYVYLLVSTSLHQNLLFPLLTFPNTGK